MIIFTVAASTSGYTRPSSFEAHTVILAAGALLAGAMAFVNHTHLLLHLKSRYELDRLNGNLDYFRLAD
jgi:hypothetical protein